MFINIDRLEYYGRDTLQLAIEYCREGIKNDNFREDFKLWIQENRLIPLLYHMNKLKEKERRKLERRPNQKKDRKITTEN